MPGSHSPIPVDSNFGAQCSGTAEPTTGYGSRRPSQRVNGSGASSRIGQSILSDLLAAPCSPVQDHPHRALTRGFTTAHRSGRSFCYADGSPAFWVFDTAWAMPFRATLDDVAVYAADRQAKGFNAALLMSVQPDMKARGPVGRNIDEGFEIGFHDLPE